MCVFFCSYRGRGPFRPMGGGGYRGANYRRGYQNQRNNQYHNYQPQQSQNNNSGAQSSSNTNSGASKPLNTTTTATTTQPQPVAVNSAAAK